MGMEIPGDCAEKFTPKKLLGEGGFGRVYLAEQKGLERLVALKVLHAETLHDEVQKKRFVEEGRITAQLSHPNVVRVIDAGAATGVPWLVYELVDGPTLKDKASRRPLTWREAIDAACSIASALEEAHRHEIFHRDVKSENVLETANGEYKLADFGIAKWSQDTGVKTRTGFVVGTPTHLAPELIRGLNPSAASDVYALGVLLYELLTGRLPFDDENLGKLMRGHLERPVPTPTRFQPDLPEELNAILKHALEKEPGDRIASARALREALERVKVKESSGAYRRRVIQAADHEAAQAGVAPRTGRNTLRTKVEVAAPPPARWPVVLACAAGIGLVAGVLALAVKPKPVKPVESFPSATPAPHLGPAILRLDGLLTETQRTLSTLGERAEALKRKAKRESMFPDYSVNTPELAALIAQGLGQLDLAFDELERSAVRGQVWLLIGTVFEELVKPMRDDPRGMVRAVGSRVDRMVERARARSADDDVFRALAGHLSAAAQFARGEPHAQGRLAAAYAAGLEVLKRRPASDVTMDPVTHLRIRQVFAVQWLNNETHARGNKLVEQLVPPLRELLATNHAAVGALSGPQGARLATMVAFHALRGATEAGRFVTAGLLPREELEAAARDALAIVAALPAPQPGGVPEELAKFRAMIDAEKLTMPR